MCDDILSFFFKKWDPKNIRWGKKKRIPINCFFKFCVIGGKDSMLTLWVAKNLHSLFLVLCFLATVFFE